MPMTERADGRCYIASTHFTFADVVLGTQQTPASGNGVEPFRVSVLVPLPERLVDWFMNPVSAARNPIQTVDPLFFVTVLVVQVPPFEHCSPGKVLHP